MPRYGSGAEEERGTRDPLELSPTYLQACIQSVRPWFNNVRATLLSKRQFLRLHTPYNEWSTKKC